MYVGPAARRRGFARRLLEELESVARELDVRVLRLETGVHQPESVALYEGRRLPADRALRRVHRQYLQSLLRETSRPVTTATVVLARGRDRSARQGHPWIFSGAVARAEGPADAPLARVISADGDHLGVGFYSAGSRIRVRLVRADDGAVDRELFRERIAEALALRRPRGAADDHRLSDPQRRGRLPAGLDGRSLRRHAGEPDHQRRARAPALRGLRCACASWCRTTPSCNATAAACGAARDCPRKTS